MCVSHTKTRVPLTFIRINVQEKPFSIQRRFIGVALFLYIYMITFVKHPYNNQVSELTSFTWLKRINFENLSVEIDRSRYKIKKGDNISFDAKHFPLILGVT